GLALPAPVQRGAVQVHQQEEERQLQVQERLRRYLSAWSSWGAPRPGSRPSASADQVRKLMIGGSVGCGAPPARSRVTSTRATPCRPAGIAAVPLPSAATANSAPAGLTAPARSSQTS